MYGLHTIRRISGIVLIVGWAVTLAVGIGTLKAGTGRGAAKGITFEILSLGVSLAATIAYGFTRLAHVHVDDIMKCLLRLQEHARPAVARIPRPQRTDADPDDGGTVHPIRAGIENPAPQEQQGARSSA